MRRSPFLFRAVAALGVGVVAVAAGELPPGAYDRAAAVRADLARADGADVLVVAHRSDWRNAPENSLAAMRRAIGLGVDIIEADVRRTKDGKFVVIHDPTLNRTTDGSGNVADHTLAEIRQLHLLAATGHPTAEKVPTLEEALEEVRGRALINLDKSFDHPEEIFAVVEACHATGYALFSVDARLGVFEAQHPGFLDKALFMIVLGAWRPDAREFIAEYLRRPRPPAVVQVTFDDDRNPLVCDLPKVRQQGARLWFNALWPEHNGGHDDELAVRDPEAAYGWLVRTGANIIQTDRPELLLRYLRDHGMRR